MGSECLDYIIGDKTVIPETSKTYFQEKVVYLPNSYMVDDSSRKPSLTEFKRADFNLPENGVVFCCFNNSYKFNKKTISSWSRIMLQVDGSVLWLSKNNSTFQKNILKHFSSLKIDEDRVIFADRIDSMGDHLARYRLADLFLDTLPFNAHTTAVDALKSGVPVLTLLGRSFAGRVGASLLNALDLTELITHTGVQYENLAVELGNNRDKLYFLKEKLRENLISMPLFNTQLFTKHIETAYIKMYARYQSDLPPEHLYI